MWVRADSVSGYISRFKVYTGKKNSSEKDLDRRVVKKLTLISIISTTTSTVITSFLVFSCSQNGIYACGAIKSNRKEFLPTLTPVLKIGPPNKGDCITV